MNRRLGRFYIARSLVENNHQGLSGLFARCTVVRCELQYQDDRFEYFAICDDFDLHPEGEVLPLYTIEVHSSDDGTPPTFKFHRAFAPFKSARELELEELLRSAHCIAERKGADTAWHRFSASCVKLGVGSITARTYKVLQSDLEDGNALP